MAKVFAPLLSLGATGTFAGIVNFVCGKYVRRVGRVSFKMTEARSENQTKWSDGCEVWSTLDSFEKEVWTGFTKWIMDPSHCNVHENYPRNGFATFMIFWMEFGSGGWNSFPLPPYAQPMYPKRFGIAPQNPD